MANTFYYRYGGKRGRRQSAKLSADLMVVRTANRHRLVDNALSQDSRRRLADTIPLFRIPEIGVEVWKVATPRRTKAARDAARTALKQEPGIRFAGRGLVTPDGEPIIYTENLFVQFHPDLSAAACKRLIKARKLKIKRPLDYAHNAYFLGLPEGSGQQVFDSASDLLDLDEVALCHPELVRQLAKKGAFPEQWHLKRTRIDGNTVDQHAHVEDAWELSRGDGATIAIIDDGVDMAHIEFAGAGKIVAPRDTSSGNDDPTPRSGDSHGTACAGVAAAAGTTGASGVAPHARVMPIRFVSSLGSQAEADAFVWAADHGADVISCSWGPTDGDWWDDDDPQHDVQVGLPDSSRLAIDYAIAQGRNGKGCVITWAAGNGNEPVDNDGYASYEKVLAIAACNDRGTRAVYSDTGAALWCAFPSNNFSRPGLPAPLTPGIWTTDVSGPSGYNPGDADRGDAAGDFTNSFGGTSSACPGAAGVAALVIARNPDLDWQQVREIMQNCCDQIDAQQGAYDQNGHSQLYGYGRLNARRAVELAVPQAAPQATYTAVHRALKKVAIKDNKTVKIDLFAGDTKSILDIRVSVDIEHTWVGDLILTLKAPDGSKAVLQDQAGGSQRNLKRSYDTASAPALANFIGADPQGKWTLEVKDNASRDTGQIISFGIELEL